MIRPKSALVWCFFDVVVSGWVGPSPPVHRHWQTHSTKRYYPARMASDNSNNIDDDGLSEASILTEKIVDLQMHTLRKSPADTLASLSEACNRLGIDAFDVYGDFDKEKEESYLRQFEAEVAHQFGKDDGVFCVSGGMAQSIVLLINAANRQSSVRNDDGREKACAFACHPTSHLVLHENNAFRELLGMEAVVIPPNEEVAEGDKEVEFDPEALKQNGCYGMGPMRLSHVQKIVSSSVGGSASTNPLTYPNRKEVNCTDITTLILELPHREVGGKLTPWNEVEEIGRLCNDHGIHYHCDGARIFEASVGYGHEAVKQTAQPFATIYVSFYKGLGAVSGAMLLGDAKFCSEARIWLRRMGGNLYSVLPYAISSWDGFRKNCLATCEGSDESNKNLVYDNGIFENRRKKLARVLELLCADSKITSIVKFDPVVPETNIVHGYLEMPYEDCIAIVEKVEKKTGIRVLSRVRTCGSGAFDKIWSSSDSGGDTSNQEFSRFEWTMGELNSLIEDDLFVLGWKQFAELAEDLVSI
mmetsp:Transcript_8458/g.18268  ORF Transcript_8458/g.18268 Transcript_8458/m.18268 type:complete len:529 (-) Transcript_8458:221-1807(-)